MWKLFGIINTTRLKRLIHLKAHERSNIKLAAIFSAHLQINCQNSPVVSCNRISREGGGGDYLVHPPLEWNTIISVRTQSTVTNTECAWLMKKEIFLIIPSIYAALKTSEHKLDGRSYIQFELVVLFFDT